MCNEEVCKTSLAAFIPLRLYSYGKGISCIVSNISAPKNYPNPFNPSTTIQFALPVTANVRLVVYNILGEQVEVLKNEMMNSGSYELSWDATASSISSGIYFYRLEADGINGSRFAETKKMILLK